MTRGGILSGPDGGLMTPGTVPGRILTILSARSIPAAWREVTTFPATMCLEAEAVVKGAIMEAEAVSEAEVPASRWAAAAVTAVRFTVEEVPETAAADTAPAVPAEPAVPATEAAES